MKKLLTAALVIILGGSCLCGNAITDSNATYCDSGVFLATDTSITINYENKDENTFGMALKHPNYTFSANTSDCACIAGANVLGFYDRYDEDLIPNHKSGNLLLGKYIYSSQDTYIHDLIRQLYNDMGTDSTGTTVTEFKNGMIIYCNRKGKSISFISCMKNNKFDYSAAKSYMESNQPIVLFCGGYNVATIDINDKSDRINYVKETYSDFSIIYRQQVTNDSGVNLIQSRAQIDNANYDVYVLEYTEYSLGDGMFLTIINNMLDFK